MAKALTQSEILDIATCMGYYILKSGGEISRAEDTAERIGLAYGMDSVHVFAVGSSIIVSVEKDDVSISQTRRVRNVATDLNKVEKYNALSRKICRTLPPFEEVAKEIHNINITGTYSPYMLVLAYAIVGGGFAVFFGGGLKEGIAAFLIGAALRLLIMLSNKIHATQFLTNAAGAMLVVSLAQAANIMFPDINAETINIGVLMNLVPGVLLVNCIRDFMATDYFAGTARIVEAIFIATAIALGVSVSIFWR